ncbi:hypothetical protein OESDEN_15118 [Oesophagostomum dentatum]|uniref:BTB domain-containing protein n=1 Tax=Oesophagostomum dentatum TaxID=61180 RepID=A0A0B1SPT0_OESDE|nr:hypothetical protein OESDEN_15118 [Oesophagostomum dentatum]
MPAKLPFPADYRNTNPISSVALYIFEQSAISSEPITLVPKRVRCAVSMRADDTDKWGHESLDEREDYQLVLRDASIKDELLSRLNTFRCNRELCDIVLFVREREIFAHKVVLAAVSPALFDMFVTENEEESSAGNDGLFFLLNY